MSMTEPQQSPEKALETEVLIAGGGMVGLSLGLTLAGAGVEVVVVDREDPATVQAAAFDGRSSAIARGSRQALAGAGLWDAMAPAAQPILDIRVSDGRIGRRTAPFFLHYDHREADGGPLGYIVENRAIRKALHGVLASRPSLRLIAPDTVDALEPAGQRIAARLGGGRRIAARLAVVAEGRNSPLREAAGIRATRWSYPQTGIVCTVAHEQPHHGVAHEHFLPAGPFAVLPMTDDEAGRHRSSLVWTERRDLAPAMMALEPPNFAAEIARRFGDSLGRLEPIGGRWSYPLSLLHAERYHGPRLALIGDSAHAIHPIAGQGLNLGLRDVAALAEVVVDARRLGLDIGAAPVLRRYERWRRFDNLALIAATDGLNRLFSNDLPPLRLARDLGLAAVDRLPPLKRLFMNQAMGLVGELPRLVRGEPL
ncbi:MAG: UbiH/UbiF/VisC/COQ6 family ubiquinone biosynthesis hydroxylase [Rhodospirillales bacterium]|nr:UbiH/UbiF/VisC/COQ6 family ubiquinone biosynthesis hydroxylase [Rhodospirillales bacterium]